MDVCLRQDQVAHLPRQNREQVLARSPFRQELVECRRTTSRVTAEQLLQHVPHLRRLVTGNGRHNIVERERPARGERRQLVQLRADRTEVVAHHLHDVIRGARTETQFAPLDFSVDPGAQLAPLGHSEVRDGAAESSHRGEDGILRRNLRMRNQAHRCRRGAFRQQAREHFRRIGATFARAGELRRVANQNGALRVEQRHFAETAP